MGFFKNSYLIVRIIGELGSSEDGRASAGRLMDRLWIENFFCSSPFSARFPSLVHKYQRKSPPQFKLMTWMYFKTGPSALFSPSLCCLALCVCVLSFRTGIYEEMMRVITSPCSSSLPFYGQLKKRKRGGKGGIIGPETAVLASSKDIAVCVYGIASSLFFAFFQNIYPAACIVHLPQSICNWSSTESSQRHVFFLFIPSSCCWNVSLFYF